MFTNSAFAYAKYPAQGCAAAKMTVFPCRGFRHSPSSSTNIATSSSCVARRTTQVTVRYFSVSSRQMKTPPKTDQAFKACFQDDRACRAFLFHLRWPAGFVCPRCKGTEHWKTQRDVLICRFCGRHTSVTAGTILQDLRQPLRFWFQAMWYVSSYRKATSAKSLEGELGLVQYRTAWAWLHKLRRVMLRAESARLTGHVDIGVARFGPVRSRQRTLALRHKYLIAVAAQVESGRISRLRLRQLDDVSWESLRAFIRQVIAPGARVRAGTYECLWEADSTELARRLANPGENPAPSKHIATVMSDLQRMLRDRRGCAISGDLLDYYLAEFAFSFKHRNTRNRWAMFSHLVQSAVLTKPVPYKSLVIRRNRPIQSARRSRPAPR
jgi:hypothetical protein